MYVERKWNIMTSYVKRKLNLYDLPSLLFLLFPFLLSFYCSHFIALVLLLSFYCSHFLTSVFLLSFFYFHLSTYQVCFPYWIRPITSFHSTKFVFLPDHILPSLLFLLNYLFLFILPSLLSLLEQTLNVFSFYQLYFSYLGFYKVCFPYLIVYQVCFPY
jgi:hypothetical protein